MKKLARITGAAIGVFLFAFAFNVNAAPSDPLIYSEVLQTESRLFVIPDQALADELIESLFARIENTNQTEAELPKAHKDLIDAVLNEQTPQAIENPTKIVEPKESKVPEETKTTEETIEEPANLDTPTTLEFSEVYPNTLGKDTEEEFVELKNTGEKTLDLKDWSVKDASEKTFNFKESQQVVPGGTHVLERQTSGLSLNNDGDTLFLYAPNNELIDQVSYGNTTQGQSYAKDQNVWAWTSSVTPNEPNVIPKVVTEPVPAPEPVAKPTSAKKPAPAPTALSITNAKEQPDGTKVILEGAVLVQPGDLGKQILYMADESSGIQVYKYDAEFPNLEVGDSVKILGELSTSRDERRIKIPADGFIQKQDGVVDVSPTEVEIHELNNSFDSQLVKIHGQVVQRSSSNITLEHNGNQITVSIASTSNIDPAMFTNGATVTVTGIYSSTAEKVRPRTTLDIQIEEVPEVAAATLTNSGKNLGNTQNKRTALLLLTGTAIIFSLLLVKRYRPTIQTYAKSNLSIRTKPAS